MARIPEYKVSLSPRALRELQGVADYLDEKVPESAAMVVNALLDEIENLGVMPYRFPAVDDRRAAGVRRMPCMEKMPALIQMAKEEAGKGVVFAGVSLDSDGDGRPREQTLREFVGKMHVPYPVLAPDRDSPVFRTMEAIPQTVLIDRHGRTARTIVGEADPVNLRAAIDQLVSEP